MLYSARTKYESFHSILFAELGLLFIGYVDRKIACQCTGRKREKRIFYNIFSFSYVSLLYK